MAESQDAMIIDPINSRNKLPNMATMEESGEQRKGIGENIGFDGGNSLRKERERFEEGNQKDLQILENKGIVVLDPK